MGNALVALLDASRRLLDRVVADRQLLPAVIEETLRWETSVTQVSRVATRRHRDQRLPDAGRVAHRACSPASANHDEAASTDSDEFDLDRPAQHHLAFGTGQHQCLGMHLARIELRVGLDAILTRLPNLRLDPDGPQTRRSRASRSVAPTRCRSSSIRPDDRSCVTRAALTGVRDARRGLRALA